ncbi:MAG: fused MFS/spermidine synthase [bacterium]
MKKNGSFSRLTLTLFFLSGFCTLLYEITWARLINTILGNSTYTISAVLSSVMIGLAVGGYVGGKAGDHHRNPLRLYGILEGLVGLYALIFPFLLRSMIPALQYIYRDAQVNEATMAAIRFMACLAVLILPFALIGAMLPILSKFLIRQYTHFSSSLGKLYGFNLLGSMTGVLITCFFFIPTLGMHKTMYVAVSIECIICGSLLWLTKGSERIEPAPDRKSQPVSFSFQGFTWLILLAASLSGAASMIYEVAWTRMNTLLIGSSVYAFGLMLAAFLGGLGIGSLLFAHIMDRRGDLVLLFGLLEIGIGGVIISLTPLFEKLSRCMVPLISAFSKTFALLQLMEFFGLFFLMLIPSAMIGIIFPLLGKMYTKNMRHVGHAVGTIFMANSFGAVLGISASGLLLIPTIGIQKTVLSAVFINISIGALALFISPSLSRVKKSLAIPIIICCSIAFCYTQPEWDKVLISGGSYIYAGIYSNLRKRTGQDLREIVKNQGDLLFYKEGVNTTVTVKRDKADQLFLQLNGKTDSSSREDNHTQQLIAHIPLLLHPQPRDIMVLGLGSGMTLRAAERYQVRHIDCLEISPAVVEASSYFHDFNDQALEDPRMRLIVRDGREHLTLSRQKYDVIISQPSNPWVAGMSGLLTQEFFQLCKNRLQKGGLCCVWLQTYNMPLSNARSVIKAFHLVFPSVSVWETKPAIDYLLIGSPDEFKIDYLLLQQRMAALEMQPVLKEIGLPTVHDLIAHFIMSRDGISRYTEGAIPHTDNNSFLEFQTPRSLYQETMGEQLQAINDLRGIDVLTLFAPSSAEAFEPQSFTQSFEAQKHFALGEMFLLKNRQEERINHLREAYLLSPQSVRIKDSFYHLLLTSGVALNQKGMYDAAIQTLSRAVQIKSEGAEGHLNLGLAYLHKGYLQAATEEFQTALYHEPDSLHARINLGAAYLRAGNLEGAIRENKAVLQLYPDHADAHFNLGIALVKSKLPVEAIREYQEALRCRPDYAEAHFNLGVAYQSIGDLSRAISEYEEALRLKPDFAMARNMLEKIKAVWGQEPGLSIP